MMGFKNRSGSDAAINATRLFPPGSKAEFDALLACYRSGQMTEQQWQQHLGDKAFAAYVTQATQPQNPSTGAARAVVVRTGADRAHFGFIRRRNGREVELDRARRITSLNGAPVLSEIATHGAAGTGIRLDVPVSITLTDVTEIIDCTPEARRSLEAE
ncbi:MAG: hypothetical protein AB7F76_00575 [Parvibaculaceae bacterium]